MDKFDKWLYFRTVTDEDNEDGTDDVLCVPASSMVAIAPTSDTTVTLTFKSVANSHKGSLRDEQFSHDTVVLTVDQGKTFEAISGIVQAINSSGRNDDGFIVIADDCTVAFGGAAGSLTTSYIHPNITACGAITVQAATKNSGMPDPIHWGGSAAPTAISDSLALSVNTRYQSIAGAAAMTLPSAAAGNPGDWITVFYNTAMTNGVAHSYTTTTDTQYSPASTISTDRGSNTTRVPTSHIADQSTDNVITITGATHGDGGKGTYAKFLNMTGQANGWACEVYVTGQGDGTAAATATFS